jgi:hypothetical protein
VKKYYDLNNLLRISYFINYKYIEYLSLNKIFINLRGGGVNKNKKKYNFPILSIFLYLIIINNNLLSSLYADELNSKFELKSPEKKFMTISTGTSWGNLAPVGSKICQLINLDYDKHNVYCSVRKSSGSDMNMERLLRKNVDFAIVGSDQAKRALEGTFRIGVYPAFPKLRSVFSLFPEQFVAVSNNKANIKEFMEFKNKILDGGEDGSATSNFLNKILIGYGMKVSDFKQITHLQDRAMIDAFCNGNIDGFVELSGSPSPKIVEALKRCGGSLVLIDTGIINFMISQSSELQSSKIPANRYPGIKYDVASIGTQALLVTSEDTDPQIIEATVMSVVNRLNEFQSSSKVVSNVSLGELLSKFGFLNNVDASKKVLHD